MAKVSMSLRNRKSKVNKSKKSAKYQVKPSKTFTKAVQKVIQKNAETKEAFLTTGNTLTMFNQNIDQQGDMMQLVPNVDKGDNSHQRTGD